MPHRFHRRPTPSFGLVLTSLTVGMAASPVTGQIHVSDEDVEIAIRRGINDLWSQQAPDGAWSDSAYSNRYPIGLTALATFALRTAGVSTDDPRLHRAIKVLSQTKSVNTTYERAVRAMVYSTLDPEQYRTQRDADARWLITAQHLSGGWGYTRNISQGRSESGRTDNSNSQFAILGLWQAAMVGSEVPRATWQKAAKHWLSSQNKDGGWGYSARHQPDSYASMTAAGVATCFILYDQLYSRGNGRFDGQVAIHCGIPSRGANPVIRAIDDGLGWLGRGFSPKENTGVGRSFMSYYHYSIERSGIASGRKLFGAHDWYREIADHLVDQQQPDGGWGTIADTCFSLLALVKGRAPILISKLQHDGDWNNNPRDVAQFTSWLGRRFERQVAWQVTGIDTPGDLHDAPILYFNGHDAPTFSTEQTERLREFVQKGGTVWAQACCKKSEFIDRVTGFFNATFPDLHSGPLPDDHPIWTIHFPLQPTFAMTAWSDGCRARIFLLHDNLCCPWHRGMTSSHRDRFELGANLVFYATNLSPLTQKRRRFPNPPVRAPKHTLPIARIKHGGDWATDPNAVQYLSTDLASAIGWAIEEKPPVDLASDKLEDLPILVLVGHELRDLSSDHADALKRFLQNGGFLIANAACGRAAFDQSFQTWISQIIPPENWRTLSSDHPILRGQPGTPASHLLNLRYARDTKLESGPLVLLPAKIAYVDHQPAVFYANLDFVCALDGHPCPGCKGLWTPDARALAVNLLIHVLRQRTMAEPLPDAIRHQPSSESDLRTVIEGRSP